MKEGLAVDAYKKLIGVLEKNPDDANYEKWMIDTYGYPAAYETNTQKDYVEDRDYFEKVLEIDPDNADAKKYIDVLNKNLKDKGTERNNSFHALIGLVMSLLFIRKAFLIYMLRFQTMRKRPKVVLLDVYETLLNMNDVERKVNSLLSSIRGYTIWFELFMEYCFVDNCTIQFNDFPSIAKATLMMAAKKLDTSVSESDADDILELLKHLPVKEGVQEGLSSLHDLNFRLAALTNASEKTVRMRMERTGLISYFEAVLSAENVRKYKPCCEVYEWAAKKLDVDIGEILLVSAHGWDIAGAANSGMQTAYLRQRNEMLYPLAPQPEYIESSIADLVEKLRGIEVDDAE